MLLHVKGVIIYGNVMEVKKGTRILAKTSGHSKSTVFGLAVLYPNGSEISRFWYIKTRKRKIAITFFFYYSYQCIAEIKSSNKEKKSCHAL